MHPPYVYRAFERADGNVKSAGYPGKVPGKLCSCEMCGNPRRHFGDRTRQELRATVETPLAILADGDGEDPCACDECMVANDGAPDACRSTPLTALFLALARVA